MGKFTRSLFLNNGEAIVIYTNCGMVVVRDDGKPGHPTFDTFVYDSTGRASIRSVNATDFYNEINDTTGKPIEQIVDIKFDNESNEFTIITQETHKTYKLSFDDIDWSYLSNTLLGSLKNLKSLLKSLTDKVTRKRIDIDLGNDVTVSIDVMCSYELISDEVVEQSTSIKSFKNYLVAAIVAINNISLQNPIPLNMGANKFILSITESNGTCVDYNMEIID